MGSKIQYTHRKTLEEIREHFIQRLEERYNIVITDDDYDNLILNPTNFKVIASKNSCSSLVTLEIEDELIWCLYNKATKLLMTVYPKELDQDDLGIIKAMLSRSVWGIAETVWKTIVLQLEPYKDMEFETRADAARYLFNNTPFANLAMDRFLYGKWSAIKMARTVVDILYGNHKLTNIDLVFSKHFNNKKEKASD